MTADAIPAHGEIDARYTWNALSVFPTVEGWEAAATSIVAALLSRA
jgi:hypothetical protein